MRTYVRATMLVSELYKISYSFASRYLHKTNPKIFNSFLRDINSVNKALKRIHDADWDEMLVTKTSDPQSHYKLLNKCIVFFHKTIKSRIKFWEMVQTHRDLFKSM